MQYELERVIRARTRRQRAGKYTAASDQPVGAGVTVQLHKSKCFGLCIAFSIAISLMGCGGGGDAAAPGAAPAPVAPAPAPGVPAPPPIPIPDVVVPRTALGISLVAGSLQRAGGQDGIGPVAQFNRPRGVAVDRSGNIYIADTGNHTIRKLSPDSTVVTLAGAAGAPGSTDGAGASARFSSPQGVAVDAVGNVYVADTGNHTVRMIDPTGSVTTVAGGAQQQGDVEGAGVAARFNTPVRVAVDGAGNVFVADQGNRKVRRIAPNSQVSTFWWDPALPQPLTGVAVDSAGNVFIARNTPIIGGSFIRKFDREGRELPWPESPIGSFSAPYASDIAVSADGAVYVASGGPVITGRDDGGFVSSISRISPTGVTTRIAGSIGKIGMADGGSTQASFDRPMGIAIGAGGLVIADTGNSAIRRMDLAAGVVTTIAGGIGRGDADGMGASARLHDPQGIAATPDGHLFVADRGNRAMRRIAPDGTVSTVRPVAANGSPQVLFGALTSVAADRQGTVYVSGHGSISPPGASYVYSVGGSGLASLLYSAPLGVSEPIAVDDLRNLYVVGYGGGGIELLAPGVAPRSLVASGLNPVALAAGFGNTLYAARADTIFAVDSQGTVSVVAGRAGQPGYIDGSGADSRFAGISALALDREGNLYIADASNTIRRRSPDGMVRTVAGTAGVAAAAPGPAPGVLGPIRGMTWSGDALFVTVDNAVLKISFSQ